MDKKIAGVIGAITGLASLDAAQAATVATPGPGELKGAQSFGELLEPIPNAVALLRAADVAAARAEVQPEAGLQVAQYHHHHHRYYRHHHHHHHRAIVIRPSIYVRGHHHHHHHHHHRRYD